MGNLDEGATNEGESVPDDVHALLADETRLRILFELADHYEAAWTSPWPTFSQLCEWVGVDDTSRFSYHLRQLQDAFVVKTDDRYRPTVSALEVVSAIRSGTYAVDVELQETDTEHACWDCGRTLVARYAANLLVVACPDHGAAMAYPVPPSAVAHRSLDALVDLAQRRYAADSVSLRRGVCPRCWGPVDVSFPRETIPDVYLQEPTVYATVACNRCWLAAPYPLVELLVRHPAVVALYERHGLEPPEVQLGSRSLAAVSEVELANPDADGEVAATVTIELSDDELIVELDGDAAVVDYRSV